MVCPFRGIPKASLPQGKRLGYVVMLGRLREACSGSQGMSGRLVV